MKRDYSLVGDSNRIAIETGLASAQWYHTEVPRAAMKALMQRSDAAAMRDTALWFSLLLLSLAGGIYFWGSWWCAPFFFVYGTLYGSSSDARWHEMGHGTAFKTQWKNKVVYHIASFMIMRNPTAWRWSHARHHTDTVIVGRDVEIALMRPPALMKWMANFFGIVDAYLSMAALLRQAFGVISPDEQSYIPKDEQPKAVFIARIHILIYALTVGAALYAGSWLPLMIIGLPRLYGAWHTVMVGLLQHGGLADNVLDHRLNSRTVYMNSVSRFLYMNMNYHVEHHMFPMVPFYALPRLHELIKHDLPAANPSIWHAYAEMLPVLRRQVRSEDFFLKRELPSTAKPYREEFHAV